MQGKKIYIAGKITGFDGFKEKFAEAEQLLMEHGAIPMNPAVLPPGFEQREYLQICFTMIGICDAVYFLDNWQSSPGANMEHVFAATTGKELIYQ